MVRVAQLGWKYLGKFAFDFPCSFAGNLFRKILILAPLSLKQITFNFIQTTLLPNPPLRTTGESRIKRGNKHVK
jgi:hypothetical protein